MHGNRVLGRIHIYIYIYIYNIECLCAPCGFLSVLNTTTNLMLAADQHVIFKILSVFLVVFMLVIAVSIDQLTISHVIYLQTISSFSVSLPEKCLLAYNFFSVINNHNKLSSSSLTK